MLKPAILTALLLCSAAVVFAQKAKPSTVETAIVNTIEQESRYFWARDFKNWKKQWVHEPYVVWSAASNSGVTQYYGWDAWEAQVKSFFKESPEAIPYDPDVKKYNYFYRIYGDGAWVSFEQNNNGTITHEFRVLERKGSQWRIAAVQLFFDANQSSLAGEGEDSQNGGR